MSRLSLLLGVSPIQRRRGALSLVLLMCSSFAAAVAGAATPLAPGGRPLRWPTPAGAERPVVAMVGYPGPGVPVEVLSRIGRGALARWQAAAEGAFDVRWWAGAGRPPVPAADGVSTVVFRSTVGVGALGRPATAWVRADAGGWIVEVDVVVDDVDFPVTVDASAADAVRGPLDLDAVLTHEMGHVLGLDHSGVLAATMLPWPHAGQAGLACDDVMGARAVFGLPGAGLSGRLVGADGAAVSGVQVVAVEVPGGEVVAVMPGVDGRFVVGVPRPGAWVLGVGVFAPGAETLAGAVGAAPCGGRVPRQWVGDPDGFGAAVFEVGAGVVRVGDVSVGCVAEAVEGAASPGAAFDPRTGAPGGFVGGAVVESGGDGSDDGFDEGSDEMADDMAAPGPGQPCGAGGTCARGGWCDVDDPAGAVCRLEVCGDGHVGVDEGCDDGDGMAEGGMVGDGRVGDGMAGDGMAGDGCEQCRVVGRLGDGCDAARPCGAGSRCVDGRCAAHVCGDGVVGGEEPCDGGWGCDAECRLDPMHDDAGAPDGPGSPGVLSFDAGGEARVGYALGVGEVDWFALAVEARSRVVVEVVDPRGARCGEVMIGLSDAGGSAVVAQGERAYGVCARLDAVIDAGRYRLRLGARGNGGHGARWLVVRRRALPGVGEACGDAGAPCPEGAWCGPERVCRVHVCGDGVRGPGEACDDGDPDAGDGCDAMCRRVPLAPGAACAVDAACGEDGWCAGGRCALHGCGDGVVGPGELCDSSEGCGADCRFAVRDRFAVPVWLDPEDGRRDFALNGIAGALVVDALDWGLHGDRSVRLSLLDSTGRVVPGAVGVAPRAVEADGGVDQDTRLVVEGLPLGDYVLRAEAHRLPARSSPRGGRIREGGAPVLLVGGVAPALPAMARGCGPGEVVVPEEAEGPPPRPRVMGEGCGVTPGAPVGWSGWWAVVGLLGFGGAGRGRRRGRG